MSKINALEALSLLIAICWAYFLVNIGYSIVSSQYEAAFSSIYGQFVDQEIPNVDSGVRDKFLPFFYKDIAVDFLVALVVFSLSILSYRFDSVQKMILGFLAVIYIAAWIYMNRFFSFRLNEIIHVKWFVIKQTGMWLPIFISDVLLPVFSLFSLFFVGKNLVNKKTDL